MAHVAARLGGWLGLVATLAAGCGARAGGASKVPVAAVEVPAGTELAVRLDETLGTRESRAGQPFTARLTAPVRDSAGDLIASPGEVVRGRVVAVDATSPRALRVAFDSLDTRMGSFRVRATVRPPGPRARWQAAEELAPNAGFSATITPGRAAIGGGPGARSREAKAENEVTLPAGTPLRLMLIESMPVQTNAR